jgi:hypothetical protein
MSALSATQALTFRIMGLTETFAKFDTPERKAKSIQVTLTGPLVTRYYAATPALMLVVRTEVTAAAGPEYVESALGFTANSSWYVLMALLGQTWAPIPGQRSDSAAQPGPSVDDNINALGRQVALLPGSARRSKFGLWGAPGSRLENVAENPAILQAWGSFVRATKGSVKPRWL